MNSKVERNKNFLKFLANSAACALTGDQGTKLLETATQGIPLAGLAIPIITAVANSISGNLASDFYGKIASLDHLMHWMDVEDPNQMNHDLEKMIYRSAISAFLLVQKTYIRKIENDETLWADFSNRQKQQYFDELKNYFKEIQKELIGEHINLYVKAEIGDISNSESLIAILAGQIRDMTYLTFERTEVERFLAFFESQMPVCLHLAVNEELKTNERAYRAYQIFIAESIKSDNANLKGSIDAVLQEIRDGNRDLFPREEFFSELEQVNAKLYNSFSENNDRLKTSLTLFFSDISNAIKETLFDDGEKTRFILVLHFDQIIDHFFEVKAQLSELREFVEKSFNQNKIDLFSIQSTFQNVKERPRKLLGSFRWHYEEFVGRNEVLRRLLGFFENYTKPVCIYGMGGVGKSTIARKIVSGLYDKYNHVVWLDINPSHTAIGSDLEQRRVMFQESVMQAFINIQVNLNINFQDNDDPAQRFLLVTEELKNLPGKNLLVIDNCEVGIKTLENRIPGLPNWETLVTSREKIDGYANEEILPMDRLEAIELFKCLIDRPEDDNDIEALIDEIDCHTLMIELVAKTIAASPKLTVNEFLRNLKLNQLNQMTKREIYLNHADSEVNLYEHLLFTFNTANLTDDEKNLLRFLYFTHPDEYVIGQLSDTILTFNSLDFNEILWSIKKKGWIDYRPSSKTYYLHSLIRRVVYYALSPSVNEALGYARYLNACYIETEKSKRFAFEAAFNYLYSCLSYDDYNHLEIIELLWHLGNIYSKSGRNDPARDCYLKAIELCYGKDGDERIDAVANIYSDIGANCLHAMRFSEAEGYFEKAIEIFQALTDTNGCNYSISIEVLKTNLGLVYQMSGRFSKAEDILHNALTLARKDFQNETEEELSHKAFVLRALGSLYSSIDHDEDAEPYLLESKDLYLNLIRSGLKEYHNDLAKVLEKLASLAQYRRLDKTEFYYNSAKEIFTALFDDNPLDYKEDIARVMANLGNYYVGKDNHKLAEEYLFKSLNFYGELIETAPENHISNYALVLSMLGNLYVNQNRTSEFEHFLVKARDILQELVKSNPNSFIHELVSASSNLAKAYQLTDRFSQAIAVLMNIKSHIELSIGNDKHTPYTGDYSIVNLNLGRIYHNINEFDNAFIYYSKFKELSSTLLKHNFEEYVVPLSETNRSLGDILFDREDYHSAKEFYLECVNVLIILSAKEPALFLEPLAHSQRQLYLIYEILGEENLKQHILVSLVQTVRHLTVYEPDKHTPTLADALILLGEQNQANRKLNIAKKNFEESHYILTNLTEQKPGLFQRSLIIVLERLESLYDLTPLKNRKALISVLVSLKTLYASCVENDPENYIDRQACAANKLGSIYRKLNYLKKAEIEMLEAQNLFEMMLDQFDTCANSLASVHFNLASLYISQKRTDDFFEQCARSIGVLFMRSKETDEDRNLFHMVMRFIELHGFDSEEFLKSIVTIVPD